MSLARGSEEDWLFKDTDEGRSQEIVSPREVEKLKDEERVIRGLNGKERRGKTSRHVESVEKMDSGKRKHGVELSVHPGLPSQPGKLRGRGRGGRNGGDAQPVPSAVAPSPAGPEPATERFPALTVSSHKMSVQLEVASTMCIDCSDQTVNGKGRADQEQGRQDGRSKTRKEGKIMDSREEESSEWSSEDSRSTSSGSSSSGDSRSADNGEKVYSGHKEGWDAKEPMEGGGKEVGKVVCKVGDERQIEIGSSGGREPAGPIYRRKGRIP